MIYAFADLELDLDRFELRRIGIVAQVSFVDREAHRALDHGEPATLTGGDRIAHGTRAVVVLVRR